MKNKTTLTKTVSERECGCQCKKVCTNALKNWKRHEDGRVYFINTKHLRVSSTKNWAKTLDQLRAQIKSGCSLDGSAVKDHFC